MPTSTAPNRGVDQVLRCLPASTGPVEDEPLSTGAEPQLAAAVKRPGSAAPFCDPVASTSSSTRLRLETARLTLRPLCDDDLAGLCSLLGDGEALALWGEPLDREGARRWIERNRARYAADDFGRYAVVLRATGDLVGDCGLSRTTVEGVPEVELGWIVASAYWGKGIATEAAEAWRDYAFTQLGLDRIVSMVSEENVASRRVAEKLGMTVERSAVWEGQPMLMYSCSNPGAAPRSSVLQSGAYATGGAGDRPERADGPVS